jgi:osmotically-inducible protein OsmY
MILAGAVFAACGTMILPGQESPATSKADNTKVNKRDRSKSEPTADQAKENSSDRDLMQNIRKSLMEDKSLSTYAHNVKVIAQNGKVTLKGPVRSVEEKSTIESKATEIAGAGNVSNELTVKAQKSNRTKKPTTQFR